MRRSLDKVVDWVAAHPLVDQLAAITPPIALLLWGTQVQPESAHRLAYYGGVAGITALVMTAAVFVCTMTYQSANLLMDRVRRDYHHLLRRNWSSVIIATFMASIVAMAAIIVDSLNTQIALTMCTYAVGLVVTKFFRAVFWLSYSLYAGGLTGDVGEEVEILKPDFLKD